MSDGLPTIAELVDRLRIRQERIDELEAMVEALSEVIKERNRRAMELEAEVARLRPLARLGWCALIWLEDAFRRKEIVGYLPDINGWDVHDDATRFELFADGRRTPGVEEPEVDTRPYCRACGGVPSWELARIAELEAEVTRLRPLAQVGRLVVGRYIVDCLPFCHEVVEALAQDLGLIRSYEDGNGDSVVEWAPGVEEPPP